MTYITQPAPTSAQNRPKAPHFKAVRVILYRILCCVHNIKFKHRKSTKMTTEPVTKPVKAGSSSEEHDSTQRIHKLEETLERERRKHKLKILELQREAELMKQRLEQKVQLREHEAKIKEEENIYLQELRKTKGKDTSTPTQDHPGYSVVCFTFHYSLYYSRIIQ